MTKLQMSSSEMSALIVGRPIVKRKKQLYSIIYFKFNVL